MLNQIISQPEFDILLIMLLRQILIVDASWFFIHLAQAVVLTPNTFFFIPFIFTREVTAITVCCSLLQPRCLDEARSILVKINKVAPLCPPFLLDQVTHFISFRIRLRHQFLDYFALLRRAQSLAISTAEGLWVGDSSKTTLATIPFIRYDVFVGCWVARVARKVVLVAVVPRGWLERGIVKVWNLRIMVFWLALIIIARSWGTGRC